jgi:hypothetical protein
MSMMCEIPARATAAMLSAFQIPPPTAIRPVTHIMSIPTFLSPSENVSFQNLMERNVIAKPEPNLDLSSAEASPES